MDQHRLEKLLEVYQTLPHAAPHEPTMLEIAGWKGDEKVASKILEFFLAPRRQHNWDTLVLEFPLSHLGWNGPQPDADSVIVQREAQTENGKFLDIVVESQAVVVGIENKITADPCGNPYEDYWKHIQFLCRQSDRTPFLLLLTTRRVNCSKVHIPLKYVTYDQLFKGVERLLRERNMDPSSRYLFYWNDFRQTMRDFSEEMNVDADFLKFFTEHHEDMVDLLVRAEKIRTEMKGEFDAAKEEAVKRLPGTTFERDWHWTNELTRPPGQFPRQWKYLLFYSYSIKRRFPSIARNVYIQAGLYLGAGWEIQVLEASVNGIIWEPTSVATCLEKAGIPTRRSKLMENFLAYGDVLPLKPGAREEVAKRFSELVHEVDRALGNSAHTGGPTSPAPSASTPEPTSQIKSEFLRNLILHGRATSEKRPTGSDPDAKPPSGSTPGKDKPS